MPPWLHPVSVLSCDFSTIEIGQTISKPPGDFPGVAWLVSGTCGAMIEPISSISLTPPQGVFVVGLS